MKQASTFLIVIVLFEALGCNAEMSQGDSMRRYGYQGNPDIWAQFLQCWTDESLLAYSKDDNLTEMERTILGRKSQGFPPATREQISNKERELNIEFPNSYKDFLLASNGWLLPNLDNGDGLILPIGKVSYFSEIAPEFYSIVTERLNKRSLVSGFSRSEIAENKKDYTENQNSVLFDDMHFVNSIAISEHVDSGIYLINVHRKTPENELEIWFYSSNHPGVYKFVSFAHLMQYAYLVTKYLGLLDQLGDSTTDDFEYGFHYGESYIEGTCAEILGFPEIRNEPSV